MKKPFFSIIIVAFNAEGLIDKTVASVLAQNFSDYEIIIKDAHSKDQTLSNIPKDPHIRVYSTADEGIYYGMNEAIGYADGKYCIFLNCGDVFYDENVLSKVYETILASKEENVIAYGDYYRGETYAKQPSTITPFYLYRTPLNHQSVFFAKSLFEQLGLYDTTFRICADYEFTLRAFKEQVPFIYCPIAINKYLGGGASESEKGRRIKKQDYQQIRSRYYTAKERKKYNIMLALSMKNIRQKLASPKSPLWVRKLYRNIVNLVNR